MKLFHSAKALSLSLLLSLAGYASGQVISGGSGSFTSTWALAGGSSYSNNFNYSLFNSSLGTLTEVQFCLDISGTGDWEADYDPAITGGPSVLDVTLFGGQSINIDGGNGFLNGGFIPVIDNYEVADSVTIVGHDFSADSWIMSPADGPSFNWSDSTAFNLPNISYFVGSGSSSATFSTSAVIDYLSNPSVAMVNEGHDYNWTVSWEIKYLYTPVPEPGSALLLGVSALAMMRRRRKKL